MATRLFFPETEAAPASPAISAAWEHQNAVRRKLLQIADSSTLTTTDYSPDAADHLVDGDAHHRQYVSDALAAQTLIASTFTLQFQCIENNAANNLFMTWKVFVCSGDGTTIKETLIDMRRDGTEVATALTNRNDAVISVLAMIEEGDRLVVEVGLGGTPTGAGGVQGHNGDLRFGCNASSGDLPEDDTQTGTTYRPWIESSSTISFLSTQSQAPRTMHQVRMRRV